MDDESPLTFILMNSSVNAIFKCIEWTVCIFWLGSCANGGFLCTASDVNATLTSATEALPPITRNSRTRIETVKSEVRDGKQDECV